MKNTLKIISGFMIIALFFQSCEKDEEIIPPSVNTCDQHCKDFYTATSLANIWKLTLDNNIGLRYTGYHDTVVSGPAGGTIHITGNFIKYSSDSAYNDYTFSFSGCKVDGSNYTMTFEEGDMGITGTYAYTSGYKNVVFLGYNIKFFGNVTTGKNQTTSIFEQSCTINFAELTSDRYGYVCGREFNSK